MARLNLNAQAVSTEDKTRDEVYSSIKRLSEIKEKSVKLEKEVKELTAYIKSNMLENGDKSLTVDNFTVELREATSVKFDEEAFIAYSHKMGYDKQFGFIRVKEVLDMDKLEATLFNGLIVPSEVDQFKQSEISYRFYTKEGKK
jgi:phage host-nuclease inhibitor protein Gam